MITRMCEAYRWWLLRRQYRRTSRAQMRGDGPMAQRWDR